MLIIQETAAHEECVLTRHMWRVRGGRGGIEREFRNSAVFRIRGGRIVETRYYWDQADALDAVGLAE